jgi:hypothetical protein
MKNFKNLEEIRKLYKNVNEDRVLEDVEILEKEGRHKEAANVLSVYVNFSISQFNKILINKNRESIKLLIQADLVNFQNRGYDYIVISRKIKADLLQSVYNYIINT